MTVPRRAMLVLAAVLTAGCAGTILVVLGLSQPGLPPPRLADRDQLVGWLVSRDLALEPAETRRELVRRLEEEFRGGVPWEETARKLSQGQRRRLWDNLPALLESWLLDKVEAYSARAGRERLAVLDGAIATIKDWQGAAALRPEQAQCETAAPADAGLMAVLEERVQALRRESAPDQRRRIEQFVAAVQARWLWQGLMGGG